VGDLCHNRLRVVPWDVTETVAVGHRRKYPCSSAGSIASDPSGLRGGNLPALMSRDSADLLWPVALAAPPRNVPQNIRPGKEAGSMAHWQPWGNGAPQRLGTAGGTVINTPVPTGARRNPIKPAAEDPTRLRRVS
jgi:hypothetical protein